MAIPLTLFPASITVPLAVDTFEVIIGASSFPKISIVTFWVVVPPFIETWNIAFILSVDFRKSRFISEIL